MSLAPEEPAYHAQSGSFEGHAERDYRSRRPRRAATLIFDVDIVNNSARSVSLRCGEVRWHGNRVVRLDAVVESPSLPATLTQAEIASDATRLSCAIPAGSSFAGAVTWTEGSSPAAVEGLTGALHAPRDSEHPSEDLPELKLQFSPGGTKTVKIELPIHVAGSDSAPEPEDFLTPCRPSTASTSPIYSCSGVR